MTAAISLPCERSACAFSAPPGAAAAAAAAATRRLGALWMLTTRPPDVCASLANPPSLGTHTCRRAGSTTGLLNSASKEAGSGSWAPACCRCTRTDQLYELFVQAATSSVSSQPADQHSDATAPAFKHLHTYHGRPDHTPARLPSSRIAPEQDAHTHLLGCARQVPSPARPPAWP